MHFLHFLLAALPAVCAAPLGPGSDNRPAPRNPSRPIPDRWIVQLADGAPSGASKRLAAIAKERGGEETANWGIGKFKAFSFTGPQGAARALRGEQDVKIVEQDQTVFATEELTQDNAPYGLQMISSTSLPVPAEGPYVYKYDSSAGEGTYAYVIDTGILTEHSDFGGRASFGANFVKGKPKGDGNGHGTHVAGTIGGVTYGVAKKCNLIGVRVLGDDGSGSISGIISGIEWTVRDAQSKNRIAKSVANLSLGGGRSAVFNDAVKAAVEAGMFVAVAAGNDNVDASNFSPASEPLACTVGAVNKDAKRAWFSNYGSLVDIFAPGVNILSTFIDGRRPTTAFLSGTSMASPHVAGLGAYLLGLGGFEGGLQMCETIKSLGTPDVVLDPQGSTRTLAYNGGGAADLSLRKAR